MLYWPNRGAVRCLLAAVVIVWLVAHYL